MQSPLSLHLWSQLRASLSFKALEGAEANQEAERKHGCELRKEQSQSRVAPCRRPVCRQRRQRSMQLHQGKERRPADRGGDPRPNLQESPSRTVPLLASLTIPCNWVGKTLLIKRERLAHPQCDSKITSEQSVLLRDLMGRFRSAVPKCGMRSKTQVTGFRLQPRHRTLLPVLNVKTLFSFASRIQMQREALGIYSKLPCLYSQH